MNINFANQVVIVTGAAHGFGQSIAKSFSQRGAIVYACDILSDSLQNTKKLCEQAGGICHIETVNVRNQSEVYEFVNNIIETENQVQIVVNNAGGVLGQVGRPLEEVSQEDWDSIYEVNARAPFFFAQAVAPTMKKQKLGRIINISSGAGLGISLTGIQAYASAKAAQISLTRQLAHELGSWNITVNCIAPGLVISNPSTTKQWNSYSQEKQTAIIENIALKRLGDSSDIANGVLFFASEFAGWITGQTLSIDGGK